MRLVGQGLAVSALDAAWWDLVGVGEDAWQAEPLDLQRAGCGTLGAVEQWGRRDGAAMVVWLVQRLDVEVAHLVSRTSAVF